MFRKILVSAGFALTLSACAGTVPVNYQPQIFVKQDGDARMGEFSYAPYEAGRVKSNQIQNTAIGAVYMALDVHELVKRATALELERAGVRLSDHSNLTISGRVLEFKADDLGWNVNWHYSVNYTMSNSATGAIVHDKTYTPPMVRTGKFGQPADFAPSINELIRSGIEAFLSDADVKAAFSRHVIAAQ